MTKHKAQFEYELFFAGGTYKPFFVNGGSCDPARPISDWITDELPLKIRSRYIVKAKVELIETS